MTRLSGKNLYPFVSIWNHIEPKKYFFLFFGFIQTQFLVFRSKSTKMFEKILLKFSENPLDTFTVNDALRGVSIFGEPASGKTSGSEKSLAIQYLKQGWGGLVLCTKPGDAIQWREYCKETERENDLIVFSKSGKHASGAYAGEQMVFNPIDYEMKCSKNGCGTINIANFFMSSYHIGNKKVSDQKNEIFWDSNLKRLISRVVDLLFLSGEELIPINMVRILTSMYVVNEERYLMKLLEIKKTEEISLVENENNFCLKCILKSYFLLSRSAIESLPEEMSSFELVYFYFLLLLPEIGTRTRNEITESFMGLLEPLMSGMLSKHFTGKTNICPEWTYEQNKIIVLDFPFGEFPEIGVVAQSIFKLSFQRCLERRDGNMYPNPVFLWANEAPYFLNPYEEQILSNSRSSRIANVFISKGISDYYSSIGLDHLHILKLDSLMGALATKIFHANSDPATNQYASSLIGDDFKLEGNASTSFLSFKRNGKSKFLTPQVLPREFTMLRNGGQENDFLVDAIVFKTGKIWSTGTNFLRTTFKQTFNS
jgi:hypothetical protein